MHLNASALSLTTRLDADMKGEIRFDHVAFRYPTRKNTRVLEDFHVEVKPGQMMALVGASGGGKSTIIKMMERCAGITKRTNRVDTRRSRLFCLSTRANE